MRRSEPVWYGARFNFSSRGFRCFRASHHAGEPCILVDGRFGAGALAPPVRRRLSRRFDRAQRCARAQIPTGEPVGRFHSAWLLFRRCFAGVAHEFAQPVRLFLFGPFEFVSETRRYVVRLLLFFWSQVCAESLHPVEVGRVGLRQGRLNRSDLGFRHPVRRKGTHRLLVGLGFGAQVRHPLRHGLFGPTRVVSHVELERLFDRQGGGSAPAQVARPVRHFLRLVGEGFADGGHPIRRARCQRRGSAGPFEFGYPDRLPVHRRAAAGDLQHAIRGERLNAREVERRFLRAPIPEPHLAERLVSHQAVGQFFQDARGDLGGIFHLA